PHRLGLIPTGWDPIALSLAADGRALFVVNSKGTGGRSTLERIELGRLNLRRSTSLALASLRRIVRAGDDPLVPQRFGTPSHVFRHVVQLSIGPATYDDVFGDLTSSTPAVDGAAVTPNLHALAHRFALAGNFYPALDPGAGRTLALAGITTLASRRALLARSGNGLGMQQDPEDYPRAGYLFNTLALAGKSFRDYGDLLDLSGYRVGADDDPPGLGGSYAFDVPALAALAGHVDLAYPASDPGISDGVRANEFVRDYEGLAARGRAPQYADVWLPGAAAAGGIAAEDRAIGQIVAAISHGPTWATTAIFIAPVAGGISENGDRLRGFALVVSPYARTATIEETHLSPESILK
ncbi:MAG: hypothetical protein ACREQ5_37045, partial [Candidatus Dormibacteria bacterium]